MNTLPDEAAPRVPVNVAIVGAQKAGTSSLFDLLRKHPGVCPGPRKEWHYFDDEKRSWEDPDHSGYWAPGRSERQRIAIDGTPSYMFWPHAMERMRAYRPDMRLIVSLRDPIERGFSHWAMYFGKLASFPSFSELAQGPPREALLDRIPAGWNHLRMRRWSMSPVGCTAHRSSVGSPCSRASSGCSWTSMGLSVTIGPPWTARRGSSIWSPTPVRHLYR
jgi:hypothetical protein